MKWKMRRQKGKKKRDYQPSMSLQIYYRQSPHQVSFAKIVATIVATCGRSYCCNGRLQSMLLHAMVGLSIATVAVFYRNRQVAKLITDERCLLHKDVIPSRWSKNQRSPSSPPQCRLLRILKNPELSYATSPVDHQRLFLALLSLCLRGGACAFFPASKKPPK